LHRGAEQFDVVHCQQLGNGKGRNRRHKHHHYAAHHSRHGERQNHLAEYAGRRGSQVLRSLNQIVVHLLKSVVNGVYHERQEVVDHTEHKGTFAQRQVQEVEQRHCGKRTYQDIHPHGEDEQHHHGA
jgi:hypothetical protein